MLYREIIAVCSEIHTKYINSLCCFYNRDGVFTARYGLNVRRSSGRLMTLSLPVPQTSLNTQNLPETNELSKFAEVLIAKCLHAVCIANYFVRS
jgi:hypothetical protein